MHNKECLFPKLKIFPEILPQSEFKKRLVWSQDLKRENTRISPSLAKTSCEGRDIIKIVLFDTLVMNNFWHFKINLGSYFYDFQTS